jgi:hypothetical protein
MGFLKETLLLLLVPVLIELFFGALNFIDFL